MASTSFNTSLPPLPSKQNYAADLISTLKQTCRSTGSQFVLLLVDKEGGSKVFGTNLFTGKLGDWFGPELRQEAKELVLHGAGASTTMGGERAGTAGGGGAATESNFASPSRKPWLNGGVAPGASSRGSNEPSHGHNTLLGGGGGGTGAGRGSAPPPHASLVDDATRPAVASGQPFNHRNFAAQSPPPRLTRSTSNTFLLEQQSFVPPSSFDQPSALPYPAVSSTVANPPLDLGSHSSSHNPNSNQFRFAPSSRPTTATGTSETTATIRERRKRQPISIQVEEWYSEAFEAKLLLKACKEVYLLWDRVIRDWEANQGRLEQDEGEGNDENEEGGGLLKQPGWWPDTVKFRADGHIGSKKERTSLLIAMLLSGTPIGELEKATNLRKDGLTSPKISILDEIYQIAKVEQERYLNRLPSPCSPAPPSSASGVDVAPPKSSRGIPTEFNHSLGPPLEFLSVTSPPSHHSSTFASSAIVPLLTSPGTRARAKSGVSRRQSITGNEVASASSSSRRANVRASPYSLSRSNSITDTLSSPGTGRSIGLSRSQSHSGYSTARGSTSGSSRRHEGLAGIASGGETIAEEEDRGRQSTNPFDQGPYFASTTGASSSALQAAISLQQANSQDVMAASPRSRVAHRPLGQGDGSYEAGLLQQQGQQQRNARSSNSGLLYDPASSHSQRMQHSPSEGSNRSTTTTTTASRRLSPTFASPGMIKSRSRNVPVGTGTGGGGMSSLEEQLSPGGRTTSSRGQLGNNSNSNSNNVHRLQIQVHPAHQYLQQGASQQSGGGGQQSYNPNQQPTEARNYQRFQQLQQQQTNHNQFEYDYPTPDFSHHSMYDHPPASAPMLFHSSTGSNDGSISQPTSSSSTSNSFQHPSQNYQPPHLINSLPYGNPNLTSSRGIGMSGANQAGSGIGGEEEFEELQVQEMDFLRARQIEDQHLATAMQSMDRQQEQEYLMLRNEEAVMSKLGSALGASHRHPSTQNLYYDPNSLQNQQQRRPSSSSNYQLSNGAGAGQDHPSLHRLDSRIPSGGGQNEAASAYLQNLSQFEFANSPSASNLLGGLGLGLGGVGGPSSVVGERRESVNSEDLFGTASRSRNFSGDRRASAEDEVMSFGDVGGNDSRKEEERKRYEGLVYG